MNFYRRKFFRELSLLSGAYFFTPFDSLLANEANASKLLSVCQWKVGGHDKASNSGLGYESKMSGKGLSFLTHVPAKHDFMAESIRPDAMLLGSDFLAGEEIATFDKVTVGVNTNYKSAAFENVPKFKILEVAGVRCGVLGVGFGEPGQRVSDTISQMNEWAGFLKSKKKCEVVFCLTECPKRFHPGLDLQTLVQSSADVTMFLATQRDDKPSKLYSLSNENGEGVFLQLEGLEPNELDFMLFERGFFCDYHKV